MDQEKTYKWVQDKLRDLQSGTIAESDRRELEALAKENPFVADALEGYKLHAHIDHSAYLESLVQRIKPVKRARRRWLIPNLTVTAVAASLILIVGFWAVMSKISSDKEHAQATAVNEYELTIESKGDTTIITPGEESSVAAAESKQPTVLEDPSTHVLKSSPSSTASKQVKKESRDEGIVAGDISGPDKIDLSGERRDSTSLDIMDGIPAPPSSTAMETSRAQSESGAAMKTLSMDKADVALMANQMDPAISQPRVTGRVMSISGEPLIGVLLYVRESNQMTTSDVDGRFELFLPKPETEIVANYAGYETEEFTARQGEDDLEIRLAESNNLLEAVVVGKGGRNRKTQQASPKMGTMQTQDSVTHDVRENLKFIDYLKTHSRFPLADATFSSAKMVTVDFLIDEKGIPGEIKIARSSGHKDLDDEAMRLIRKGPDWECMSGSPCSGRYSIYFK